VFLSQKVYHTDASHMFNRLLPLPTELHQVNTIVVGCHGNKRCDAVIPNRDSVNMFRTKLQRSVGVLEGKRVPVREEWNVVEEHKPCNKHETTMT